MMDNRNKSNPIEIENAIKNTLKKMLGEAICNCSFPDTVYRNGSGHDPSCPVHIQFCKEHGWPLPKQDVER
jgi:hypothetical protein